MKRDMANSISVFVVGIAGRALCTVLVTGLALGILGCGGGDSNGGDSGGGGGDSSGGGAPTQFAYVANFDSDNVSIFGMDANGALSFNGIAPAGSHPHMITMDPQGRFVYVANHDSNFLSGYSINRTSGALTPVSGTLTVANQVHASAFDSQGRFLYVIAGTGASSIHAFAVNGDGTLTSLGPPLPAGTHAHNLTVTPGDTFVLVACEDSNETLSYTIQANGSLVQGGSVAGSGGGVDAVAAVSSFAYAANRGGLVQNFSVDPSTGVLTPVPAQPTISAGTTTHALATDVPNRNFLYAANINSSDISAYRIDKTTGTLAAISPGSPFSALGAEPEGLAASGAGFLFSANHGSNTITRFVVNANTGELTQGRVFTNPTGATGPVAIAVTNF